MSTTLWIIGVLAYFLIGAVIAGLTRRFVDGIEQDFHTMALVFVWPLSGALWLAWVCCNWIATRIDDAMTARSERREKGGDA